MEAQKKRRNRRKIAALKLRLGKIDQELSALRQFRRTPHIEKLERHLQGERSYVKEQIRKLERERIEKPFERTAAEANKRRSESMKKQWRFFKAIQKNQYPDKSVKEIRSEYSKLKKGMESDIPDVVWRNPSP